MSEKGSSWLDRPRPADGDGAAFTGRPGSQRMSEGGRLYLTDLCGFFVWGSYQKKKKHGQMYFVHLFVGETEHCSSLDLAQGSNLKQAPQPLRFAQVARLISAYLGTHDSS